MANTPRWLTYTNGFVPAATGQAISYIRSPEKFALNEYVQYIESDATVGLYAVIDRDTPARVVQDSDFDWTDGARRPESNWNGLSFNWVQFTTKRRNYSTTIGQQSIDMAKDSWKPLEHTVGALTQQAMTNRTNRIMTLLETTSNWGNNTADANSLNGGAGTWDKASDDPSSANFLAIKKSLMEAVRQITLATNAVVGFDELVLLVSPGLAEAMANSAEIHAYLRNGPQAYPQIEDKARYKNDRWGLPPSVYGLPLIVEQTVRVTDRASDGTGTGTLASSNRVFAKSDKSAVILSRKGGIDGSFGSPSFSTVQLYWYEYAMAVFTFEDAEHQLVRCHATDQFAEILAAPESGYLLTNCI